MPSRPTSLGIAVAALRTTVSTSDTVSVCGARTGETVDERTGETADAMTGETYYPLFAGGTRLNLEDLEIARALVEAAVLEDGQDADWSRAVSDSPDIPRYALWFHVDGEVARIRLIGGADGFLYVDVPFGDENTGAPDAGAVGAEFLLAPSAA